MTFPTKVTLRVNLRTDAFVRSKGTFVGSAYDGFWGRPGIAR